MSKALILDPVLVRELIRDRQNRGIDKYDEVWDGVYVMPAMASNPHQDLVLELCVIFHEVIVRENRGRVQPGANVSDRRKGWEDNHRCPDIVIVLENSRAVDCTTHWFGGPDFLVEIQSPGDDSEKKIPFYSKIAVQELLIIHRDERTLRLYRHNGQELVLIGESSQASKKWLTSEVIPLAFRWKANKNNPGTEVKRTHGKKQTWLV
jgi:Uma2 family endonuclease